MQESNKDGSQGLNNIKPVQSEAKYKVTGINKKFKYHEIKIEETQKIEEKKQENSFQPPT